MSSSPELRSSTVEQISQDQNSLPISSIVRAVCQAASSGPDLLYEVMLKLSLMVEATAPTYGLSIWTLTTGQRPRLKWVEGLEENEIAKGQNVVAETLSVSWFSDDYRWFLSVLFCAGGADRPPGRCSALWLLRKAAY